MAIKIQGSTIIDDSRNVVNASNIGIGTTNPTVELDVDGDVNISGIATITGGIDAIGIQSGGVDIATGAITALNFVGAGNTFALNGSVVDISIDVQDPTIRTTNRFVATASQSSFTVSYSVGYVDVFLNGSKLDSTEYTATNGTSVSLTTAAAEDDIVEIVAYESVGIVSITSATQGLDVTGHLETDTLNVSGVATITGGIDAIGIQSGGVNIATGIITALNFIGAGNTFALNGTVVDISIAGGGGGISSIADDTAPQLGGDLDLNDQDITGTGNLSITGVVTATSFVKSSNSGGFLKADGVEDTNTYLTSYTETQTLDDVVGLGSDTTQTITVGTATTGIILRPDGTLNVSVASTIASLTLSNSGIAVTAILDEDLFTSNRADALATQQSIKTYVDSQITAQDLNFTADTGGTRSIDLDSETLSILGTANEIETAGSSNTVTIGLPNVVAITTSLTVGSGDVGIGTTNPTAKLDVRGTLNVSGISTFGGAIDLNSSNTSFSDRIKVGRYIKGESGQKLTIGNTGSNGILLEGTASATLTVSANGIVFGSAPIKFYSSEWTINNDPTITLAGTNDSANIVGNIGIGSAQPTAKLDVNGTLNVTGVSTFNDDVNIIDDKKLLLGTGKDLEIYHQSSNSNSIISNKTNHLVIRNDSSNASKNVYIQSDNEVKITSIGGAETFAAFYDDAQAELYYNNSKKFETTGVGVSIVNGTSDTATIYGPSNLIIDPMPVGVGTTSGVVRIKGDLFVDGTTTQINSTTLEIADFIVGIASTATTDLLADGAGIGIGSDKTFLYEHNGGTNPSLQSSENLSVATGKVYQIGTTERLSADTLSLGTGTTIHSPASNRLIFGTNGQERVRINASGKVGIGTDTPTQELHVEGNALVNGNLYLNDTNYLSSLPTGDYGSVQINGDGKGTWEGYSIDGKSVFMDNGNNFFGLYDDANNHWAIRHFRGSNSYTELFGGDQSANLIVHGTDVRVENVPLIGGGRTTLTGTASQNLQFDGGGYFSGDVGIGTTNPTAKLDVDGTVNISGVTTITNDLELTRGSADGSLTRKLIIGGARNNGSDFAALQFKNYDSNSGAVDYVAAEIKGSVPDVANNGGELVFLTAAVGTTSQTERVRITSAGDVGIGTINPTEKLHVEGNANISGITTATSFSGELHTTSLLKEEVNITAGKLSDHTNIDTANGMVHLFTTTETTTSTPNIRYDASNTLNSKMNVGETIAVSIITTCAAAGYSTAISIDGVNQTVRWNGGALPSEGGSSGNDIYSFQTLKTGANTYIVFGSLTNFAAG